MINNILNKDELKIISEIISEIEKKTSGEICIVIKSKRSIFDFRKTARELAVKEFFKNKIDKTIDRSGVLIYILVKEHKFEIIADIGIEQKVAPFYWNVISDTLIERFKKSEYLKGISDFVNEVGLVLIKEFPIKENDTNEISNEIIIR